MLRPLRLGATIRSARVTSAAERTWYGSFPLELKLPLFDSVAGKADNTSGPPSNYPHGILWEGTISSRKPGYLTLTGEFSMPRYIHGDAMTSFTVEWLNGDFEFELQVLWNTSDIAALNVQGSYSSPVYLGATKKYLPLQKEIPNELFDADGEFISIPSLDIDPVVKRAPIILLGTYSADRKSFLWSGNVSAVIPDVIQVTPWSKSSYWSNVDGDLPLEHLPWVERKPEVEVLPSTARAKSVLGVSVSNGQVLVVSNGTVVNFWDGKLPLAIPMSAFSRTTEPSSRADQGKHKPSYASGLIWDATLKRLDTATLRLQGNFSLPIYVHRSEAHFPINWKTGKISIDFQLRWNASVDVFKDGQNYSSSIFLHATKPSDNTTDIIRDLEKPGSVEGNADLQFVALGVAEANCRRRAPIILHGSFSPDKSLFLWFGNVTVILPSPADPIPPPLIPPSLDEVSGKVAVGAEVIGGSVDAGVTNSSFSSVWNGDLPVPILRPDLLARAITWKGELTSTSLTQAQLDGAFSIVPSGDAETTSNKWYQGKFSLQLNLLWNVAVDGLLPEGATVFSPISLRGSAAPDDAEAWFSADEDSSPKQPGMAQQGPAGSITVPVILQGAYSADLTTFWWSGRIILAFPPVSSSEMKQLRLTKLPALTKPPLPNSFMVMPRNENSATATSHQLSHSIRLGATVRSATIVTSAGSVWSGELPLKLALPAVDSIRPGNPSIYSPEILLEGAFSTESPGDLSFAGEFSMPRYVHDGSFTNVSTQWINGHCHFDLHVYKNSPDTRNFDMQGVYSSRVFLAARQMYYHLKDVPTASLSDVSDAITLTPSLSPTPSIKKASIMLLGTFSHDGMSFIWSGNVTLVIPGVSESSEVNEVNPPGLQLSIPQRPEVESSEISATAAAVGISVSKGNVSVITNGSYVSWWNGSLPLSIPIPAFNRDTITLKHDKVSKGKPNVCGLIWKAILQRYDNVTLRVLGNFSAPSFVHGPRALFAIHWKNGNFSLNFKLRWNTSLDDVFKDGRKYYSPVIFRASKPNDSVSDIITEMQSPNLDKDGAEIQFVSTATVQRLPRAPIILHGIYSPDKTKFLWYGNATIILPRRTEPILLNAIAKEPTGPTLSSGRVSIGAEVLDGDAVAGTSGSAPSKVWNGEIPVAIRRLDLLARGVTWKGELTQTSPIDVLLNGTFSAVWTSADSPAFPFSIYEGKFSVKLGLLWNVSANDLLPADATVYSPISLRGRTLPNEAEAWSTEEEDPRRMAVEIVQPQNVAANIIVPIVLQGTYSPDLTTFWWTGRIILSFPQPSTVTTMLHETLVTQGNSVGATVTSGIVTLADSTQLWDGDLPLVLPLELETVVWNGTLTPSVGGTVELHGSFYQPDRSGEFALVLSPLWRTPLAGHIVPGTIYTSPLYLRKPMDPAPPQMMSEVSEGKVPIILQGSFSSDKTSFLWSGNVIMMFP